MINSFIISQWSSAFYNLVVEEKKIKEYSYEAIVLIDLLQKYPEFLDIVSSSILPFSERSKIIRETFADFSLYTINFLLLLAQENYFRYLLVILREFVSQCNAYYHVEYGVIYSVVELSSQQIKKIEKKISLLTSDAVKLVNQIDKSLIAGIKIKVKNRVFDGSIKGQIDQLKNGLFKNSQE
ncbi:MAG: F0F1 ATP synthase subunit delta [Spiroplasma sp.]